MKIHEIKEMKTEELVKTIVEEEKNMKILNHQKQGIFANKLLIYEKDQE